MATVRQKLACTETMGMWFLEIGKIPTCEEYKATNPVPLRISQIKNIFGNWNRMMRLIETAQPVIWEELNNPKPKAAIPKVAAKPAKVAVEAK